MSDVTSIGCKCGQTRIELTGAPITSVECCCTSCRDAAGRMAKLDNAPRVLSEHNTTPFVMYRKDRVRFLSGTETFKLFRLSPDASTKRIIATCCNTPVYLEFKGGHWLSLFGGLWPAETMPKPVLRTMTSDLPDATSLPDDIPNAKRQNLRFFGQLFGAWAAMRFRNPKTPEAEEILF